MNAEDLRENEMQRWAGLAGCLCSDPLFPVRVQASANRRQCSEEGRGKVELVLSVHRATTAPLENQT